MIETTYMMNKRLVMDNFIMFSFFLVRKLFYNYT